MKTIQNRLFDAVMTAVCLWALASPSLCQAFCDPAPTAAESHCHEPAPADPQSPAEGEHGDALPCCDNPTAVLASPALHQDSEHRELVVLPRLRGDVSFPPRSPGHPERASPTPGRVNSPFLSVNPPRLVFG